LLRDDQKVVLNLVHDFNDVFNESPQGQRIMEHLKERFFHGTTTALNGQGQPMYPIDSNQLLLNEGNRQVVLYMLGMAETSVSALSDDMERENADIMKPLSDLGI
jgi:hypothetical protein